MRVFFFQAAQNARHSARASPWLQNDLMCVPVLQGRELVACPALSPTTGRDIELVLSTQHPPKSLSFNKFHLNFIFPSPLPLKWTFLTETQYARLVSILCTCPFSDNKSKTNANRASNMGHQTYVGVLISLWLFLLPIFLFTAQPKEFFLGWVNEVGTTKS
jgi:hypothetical protein